MFAGNSGETRSLKPGKKAWSISLAGLTAGSIFGTAAWFLLFTTCQGLALISIGRFDNTSPRPDQPTQVNWIEEPQVLAERMKSLGFAKSVAERAKLPEIATLLPARQYGGGSALSVRSLRDTNLIEIKVNAKNPATAHAAIEAIVEELVSEHTKRMAPLLRDAALRLQSLNDLATDARKSRDRLTKQLEELPPDGQNVQQSSTLLALKSTADNNLAAIEKTALEVETALSGQSIRNTRVIQAATVITPKLSSLFQTILLSAVAGLILAFLCLQTRPHTNRIEGRGTEDAASRPVSS
jgi:hypothetical protein